MALLLAAGVTACEPKLPKPESTTGATSTVGGGAALPGVKPHDSQTDAASERPGAAAMGAIEAGQAGAGGGTAAHPAPTGGDGVAPASGPAASTPPPR